MLHQVDAARFRLLRLLATGSLVACSLTDPRVRPGGSLTDPRVRPGGSLTDPRVRPGGSLGCGAP
eukprot:227169-Chlamydomonas_euryale.AAC.1